MKLLGGNVYRVPIRQTCFAGKEAFIVNSIFNSVPYYKVPFLYKSSLFN